MRAITDLYVDEMVREKVAWAGDWVMKKERDERAKELALQERQAGTQFSVTLSPPLARGTT